MCACVCVTFCSTRLDGNNYSNKSAFRPFATHVELLLCVCGRVYCAHTHTLPHTGTHWHTHGQSVPQVTPIQCACSMANTMELAKYRFESMCGKCATAVVTSQHPRPSHSLAGSQQSLTSSAMPLAHICMYSFSHHPHTHFIQFSVRFASCQND